MTLTRGRLRERRENEHRQQPDADQRGGRHRHDLSQRHPDLCGGYEERPPLESPRIQSSKRRFAVEDAESGPRYHIAADGDQRKAGYCRCAHEGRSGDRPPRGPAGLLGRAGARSRCMRVIAAGPPTASTAGRAALLAKTTRRRRGRPGRRRGRPHRRQPSRPAAQDRECRVCLSRSRRSAAGRPGSTRLAHRHPERSHPAPDRGGPPGRGTPHRRASRLGSAQPRLPRGPPRRGR